MENTTQQSPATTTPASISMDALLKKTVTPTASIEFKEGIVFDLAFLPKAAFRSMVDDSTEHVYNPQTKARVPQLNSKLFNRKFLSAAVRGWKGVTPRSLSKVSPISVDHIEQAQMDLPIDFSVDNLVGLMEHVYELDTFIQNAAMDITFFRPSHGDEVKN